MSDIIKCIRLFHFNLLQFWGSLLKQLQNFHQSSQMFISDLPRKKLFDLASEEWREDGSVSRKNEN